MIEIDLAELELREPAARVEPRTTTGVGSQVLLQLTDRVGFLGAPAIRRLTRRPRHGRRRTARVPDGRGRHLTHRLLQVDLQDLRPR